LGTVAFLGAALPCAEFLDKEHHAIRVDSEALGGAYLGAAFPCVAEHVFGWRPAA
jgi:hypothetical protein